MTIPFKSLPSNIRVPLFYAEVDNSQANSATATQRSLIIGQMASAGSGVANVPVISQGLGDAQSVGGPNSMLAGMLAKYRLADTLGEVWYLPLADAVGSVAAVGSITFTAAASANGVLSFYLGDVRYQLPVLTTQTVAQIAMALTALINSDATCPFAAAAEGGAVTLTAVNKGPCGNGYILQTNYQGTLGGEATPAGLAFTIVQPTGGIGAPDLTTALANLGSHSFDFIACPYTDTTSLNALKALLNASTGRWSWSEQLYGGVFASADGTLGALTTLGAIRNNPYESILGFHNCPTPAHLRAAVYCGAAAASLKIDPALPLQTVVLPGILPPPLASRFALTDRNTLLYTGISTFDVAADGTVSIENAISTYQQNSFGDADNSYLEIETLYTLAYVLRNLRSVVTSKFARVKLAADGTRFAAGSAIVTPSVIRTAIINQARALESAGFLQNVEQFKRELVVEQNKTNPNRVDVLYPPTLVAQLRIFAVLAQFRLQ